MRHTKKPDKSEDEFLIANQNDYVIFTPRFLPPGRHTASIEYIPLYVFMRLPKIKSAKVKKAKDSYIVSNWNSIQLDLNDKKKKKNEVMRFKKPDVPMRA